VEVISIFVKPKLCAKYNEQSRQHRGAAVNKNSAFRSLLGKTTKPAKKSSVKTGCVQEHEANLKLWVETSLKQKFLGVPASFILNRFPLHL